VVGPSDTVKAHPLKAFDHATVDHAFTVAWFTLESFRQLIVRDRTDGSVGETVEPTLTVTARVVSDPSRHRHPALGHRRRLRTAIDATALNINRAGSIGSPRSSSPLPLPRGWRTRSSRDRRR
jgi:hypothetical protein